MIGGRPTATQREAVAGCFVCSGSDAKWRGGQAQGTAARHHDATGHATWCDVMLSVRYGRRTADDAQMDVEDAIAAVAWRAVQLVALAQIDLEDAIAAAPASPAGAPAAATADAPRFDAACPRRSPSGDPPCLARR